MESIKKIYRLSVFLADADQIGQSRTVLFFFWMLLQKEFRLDYEIWKDAKKHNLIKSSYFGYLLYFSVFCKIRHSWAFRRIKRLWLKFYYWIVLVNLYALSEMLMKLLYNLPGRKVYAARFSRDCDMFERTWAQEYPNIWAFKLAVRHVYDDAEGEQPITRITKKEYDEFEPSHRDRVMEAYENGRGNSIYV
jgi:hypothetical protein